MWAGILKADNRDSFQQELEITILNNQVKIMQQQEHITYWSGKTTEVLGRAVIMNLQEKSSEFR